MSASAAGAMLVWMGGLMLGVGAVSADPWPLLLGSALSLLGMMYVRKFAEAK